MKNLHFLENNNIDLIKWDLLVDKFAQGFPYAYSWYLDSVCDNWCVIIMGDYEAGFAFQIKKKKGIAYSLQPFLVQQLGFLGEDQSILPEILSIIDKKVFHYHYHLYDFNSFEKNLSRKAVNYELDLNKSHQVITAQFSTNTKRNLKKAYSNHCTVTIDNKIRPNDFEFILNEAKLDFGANRQAVLKKLLENSEKQNALEIYRAEKDSQLLALVIFIKTKQRSVYLMAVSNEESKQLKSNFLLVDQFIKNNAETNILLDFEGSNLEGIARFYAGFGAIKKEYNVIKKNSLRNTFGKLL